MPVVTAIRVDIATIDTHNVGISSIGPFPPAIPIRPVAIMAEAFSWTSPVVYSQASPLPEPMVCIGWSGRPVPGAIPSFMI